MGDCDDRTVGIYGGRGVRAVEKWERLRPEGNEEIKRMRSPQWKQRTTTDQC